MSVGPDRQALLDELDRLERELGDLVEPVADSSFDWQPDGGRGWSVGQCVDHLARANREYVRALGAGVGRKRDWLERLATRRAPRAAAELAAGLGGRLFLWTLEPPPRFKVPAPGRIAPASRCPKRETVEAFRAAQAEVRDLVRATAGLDLHRVRFPNPFVGGLPLLTVATGLLVIPAHERRHLLQIRRLLARPDYPLS